MAGYFFMAKPIKNEANAKFYHDLNNKIKEHPDRHLLNSKRAKLESMGLKF
jgi:hypothetical protein